MKTYHPLGKQQWEKLMMCRWNCFPATHYVKAQQKKMHYRPGAETPKGCLMVGFWFLFICKLKQMWCFWKEETLRGLLLSLAQSGNSQTLCSVDFMWHNWIQINDFLLIRCYWQPQAARGTSMTVCVCLLPTGLTIKTAVPGILGHAAAHRLVPLSDVARPPI